MLTVPEHVLEAYGFQSNSCHIELFGTGLINGTWKIIHLEDEYILQTINQQVFQNPQAIATNIEAVGKYLITHHPAYFFVHPIPTKTGAAIFQWEGRYYRMFPFVKGSHAKTVVESGFEAYEAAFQFGNFTRLLKDFDAQSLQITLPDFHNLVLRYQQFEAALVNGNKDRMLKSDSLIQKIQSNKFIVSMYQSIHNNPEFHVRVTHHDTKISNVLFDQQHKGICVIDLDTMMPGLFISDVGDMMRTYLCPVSEEESDFSKIEIRDEIYTAIVNGYADAMGDSLSETEKQYFFYAGSFMIYMQALRFLTDYLMGDIYYGAKYEDQNFIRASNQICLLEKLLASTFNNIKNEHAT